MIWTLLLGILAVIVLIYFFNSFQNKYQSFQGNVYNFVIIFILLFLFLTVAYFYTTTDYKVKDLGSVIPFFKSYLSWMGNFVSNAGNVAGYAVKQNWSALDAVNKSE